MEKNIKDYLHLYLGCRVVREGGGKVLLDTDNLDYIRQCNIYNEIKPILRPIKDMTEDDVKEWNDEVIVSKQPPFYCVIIESKDEFGQFTEVYPDGSILSRSKDDGESRPINGGKLFLTLLSKHFDLFGLIEEGLAIDATKEAVK